MNIHLLLIQKEQHEHGSEKHSMYIDQNKKFRNCLNIYSESGKGQRGGWINTNKIL